MPNMTLFPNWEPARPVTALQGAELSSAVAFVFDRWSGALQAVVYAADDGHELMSAGRSAFLSPNTDTNNQSIIDTLKNKLKSVAGDVIIWWTCAKSEIARYESPLQTVHPKVDLRYIVDNYPNAKRFYLEESGVVTEFEQAPAATSAATPDAVKSRNNPSQSAGSGRD